MTDYLLDWNKLEAQMITITVDPKVLQTPVPITNIKYVTLSEKPKLNKDFCNVKIDTKNTQISALVQQKLFDEGCAWRGLPHPQQKRVQTFGSKYLYVDANGSITHDESADYFANKPNRELKFDIRDCEVIEMVPMTIRKVEVVNFNLVKELVEFGGKKYIKEDLEKALSLLKSV